MSTDTEWQAWAVQDPYFAVLTNPKYRSAALTPETRIEFFKSGEQTVASVLAICRQHIDGNFQPERILDFGCGVGRMAIAFAARAREVVGMDIAEFMLLEAKRNCEATNCQNLSLVLSDDTLSHAPGQFDLVHTCLVLQHVELARGRSLFAELVAKIKPGGIGAIQLPFGLESCVETFGALPPPPSDPWSRLKRFLGRTYRFLVSAISAKPAVPPDPEMQMNYYNLNELMFVLKQAGVERMHSKFTNHGGALGVFMFFQRPIGT
jgi:ubiquinone/menaquinone biosynthesis C-methylase UbiE